MTSSSSSSSSARSADDLVGTITDRLAPLDLALAEAWWESSTASSPEADARRAAADLARREVLADRDAFTAVRAARDAGTDDPVLARCLAVLHDGMLPHQLPTDLLRALVDLETAVDARYTEFRADLDGTRVDDNALLDVLRTSDDSGERRAAWEAGKQIGAEVADDVRALARLRNEGAHALGYRDHFALALATGDLDEARLLATLDEVERLTDAPFRAWKAELDAGLAERFGVAIDELAPWHLDDPFFQDPPDRRRGGPRPLLRGRRPRGDDPAHVRRRGPRHRPVARRVRPLRARREEPARVLHPPRPRR